jgi:hypothetical protein
MSPTTLTGSRACHSPACPNAPAFRSLLAVPAAPMRMCSLSVEHAFRCRTATAHANGHNVVFSRRANAWSNCRRRRWVTRYGSTRRARLRTAAKWCVQSLRMHCCTQSVNYAHTHIAHKNHRQQVGEGAGVENVIGTPYTSNVNRYEATALRSC